VVHFELEFTPYAVGNSIEKTRARQQLADPGYRFVIDKYDFA